ncbi:MAG: hypothetical protein J5588_05690 [Bacteroidales bacterium]|nr:hypothetical protein [Bacteroidales bacterium]
MNKQETEKLLEKIKPIRNICSQKKIDLEVVDYHSLKQENALQNAIGLFYAYFDGFLPRVENYVTLNSTDEVITVFNKLVNDFNWNNIGELDIENFLTEYKDPRNDKGNTLWQPMPISNVIDGPNEIFCSDKWNNDSFDPRYNACWSFADVRGCISIQFRLYKENK